MPKNIWKVEVPLANHSDLAAVADDPPTSFDKGGRAFVWAMVRNDRMPELALRLPSGVEVYLDGDLHWPKGGRLVISTTQAPRRNQGGSTLIKVRTGFDRKSRMIPAEIRKLPPKPKGGGKRS